MTSPPLVELRDLKVHYPVRSGVLRRTVGHVKAVDGVDLEVRPGETLGLVGESGCGKTTLSRALLRLVLPTSGEIRFEGSNIHMLDKAASKRVRRDIQIIFQDPVSSLNPRFRVRDIILEGRRILGLSRRSEDEDLVQDMLEKVGLTADIADRFPHELSGGQRQRVGIARTLILRPKFIVADEPVSALDVSIQAQVINLLVELRKDLGLTYIVIAHNLAVVGYIADRVAVMYLGKVIELAPCDRIYDNPLHPYTVALLSAMPDVKAHDRRDRIRLEGDVPSPIDLPSGCRFRTRCPIASEICSRVEPALDHESADHQVACHFPGEIRHRNMEKGGYSAPGGAISD